MGDSTAGKPAYQSRTMGEMAEIYGRYIPTLTQTTAAQQPGIEQQQFNAAAGVSPQYSELGLRQLQQNSHK